MTKPYTELSVVRLRRELTEEKGRPVAAGTVGAIVHVHPTLPNDEPTYIVELVPYTAGLNLVRARHGDLALVRPFVLAPKTPWLSGILFAGACIFGVVSGLSIPYCADVIRARNFGSAVGFIRFVAPFLVILPPVLIALPSGILFKRGRRSFDLASLLLSSATVLVTIIEVIVLMSADLHGC